MTRPGALKTGGFLVLEILIAGLILTSGIAATMYLFRMGFEHLERAKISNTLSAKLIQASGLIRTLDLQKKNGTEDMGDGVRLTWEARPLSSIQPIASSDAGKISSSLHDLFLYRVDFHLSFQGVMREYQIHVFRYKSKSSTKDAPV